MWREGSTLTPRRVLVLISNLPADSVYVALERGGEQFIGWDSDRYILTNILDAIQHNTYALVSANSQKKVTAPEPAWRPDTAQRRKDKQRSKANPFAQMLQAAKRTQEQQKG